MQQATTAALILQKRSRNQVVHRVNEAAADREAGAAAFRWLTTNEQERLGRLQLLQAVYRLLEACHRFHISWSWLLASGSIHYPHSVAHRLPVFLGLACRAAYGS